MRKELRKWEIVGFAFTCLFGTLLHFLYEWTGENPFAAAIAGVNESTWEHMKLLFIPFFLFTMVEFTVFAEPFRNFFAVKGLAMWTGLITIPVLFYTLNGMFGKTPDAVNIAIFVVSAAVTFFVSYQLLTSGALSGGIFQLLGFLALWTMLFLFVFFTYRTPQIPLFRDPVTLRYGMEKG